MFNGKKCRPQISNNSRLEMTHCKIS